MPLLKRFLRSLPLLLLSPFFVLISALALALTDLLHIVAHALMRAASTLMSTLGRRSGGRTPDRKSVV